MSDTAIRVENLGKQYHIGRQQARYKTIRETIVDGAKAPFRRAGRVVRGRGSAADLDETIWALKDVSFEVKQGEVVGVIGRNGAGKTTLLKLLSRITEPTEGDAWIHGRVGSLLEVGTGFHPELTGRENVFLNGAILGMQRNEIDRKFDEIVDFSGIEKFIDTPVKHYSSGMYVRLAFSVAAHMETEILLVDEVLAVGDAQFQKKCLDKMEDVGNRGRTVLFVSHQMPAVQNLCTRVVLLSQGNVVSDGLTHDIIRKYLSSVGTVAGGNILTRRDRQGTGDIRFLSLLLKDRFGEITNSLINGEDAFLELEFDRNKDVLRDLHLDVGIDDQYGQRIALLSNVATSDSFPEVPLSADRIRIQIKRVPLMHGRYTVTLFCKVNGEIADWVKNAGAFSVEPGDYYGSGKQLHQGKFLLDHSFGLIEAFQ